MIRKQKNIEGQHLMKSNKLPRNTLLRFSIFVVVVFFIVGGGWIWWLNGIAPVDPSDQKPVIFVVERGQGVRDIASDLRSQRLIRSSTSFFLVVKFLGVEKELQAGDYRLNRAMDAQTIARELTHGILDVWVTILEGWREEEIATKLAKDLDIPEAEFIRYAREGYMFPDTYLIPRDATPAAVAKILLDTFETKVTNQMREDAKKTDLTFPQVIILASIVEREGRTDTDRPIIAGVLFKRLKVGWPIQADATLQYALGYQAYEKSWWKKILSLEDKSIKSPYNTYLHSGLPPGPIANPGLSSIKAVIYAQESDYWYYIHDSAGNAHFAKSIEEHEQNIRTYLQ